MKKSRVILEIMENDATTEVSTPRTNNVNCGAIHKPRKFKIAKMWGLFINHENSNFAKFKTAKLEKSLYTFVLIHKKSTNFRRAVIKTRNQSKMYPRIELHQYKDYLADCLNTIHDNYSCTIRYFLAL